MTNRAFDTAWDTLLCLGIDERTLRIITTINGASVETLESVLFAEFGYRTFDQLNDEMEEL